MPVLDIMATSILISGLPVGAPTRTWQSRQRQLGRLSSSTATFFRSNGTPLFSSGENRLASGLELGVLGCVPGRRGVLAKAQENDNKPFYAAVEFWVQVAVVILTFGFVDAGYSGDWSRIGALSRETEAQLRTAAYVVVPLSAALVWVIGNRKRVL